MGLSRKDFLLSSAGLFVAAGSLGGNGPRGLLKASSAKTLTGTEMAILYDSSKCIGCKMCEECCSKENNLPAEGDHGELSETSWTAIKTIENGNKQDILLKQQCMHCTDASCVAVCPTGAAAHQGESVVIDQEWCIGCGYCEEACPFGVPHRGHPPGTARKCTFCFDHVRDGSKPGCAEACPTGATTFGARSDLLPAARTRVETLRKLDWPEAQVYGENELGGLNVIYVLLKPPVFYGLPEQPRQATKNVIIQWASGTMVASVAVWAFWYYHHRASAKDKKLLEQKEGTK